MTAPTALTTRAAIPLRKLAAEAADAGSEAREFPGLRSILRLIEESIGYRDATTIVSRIAAGLAPLMREHAGALPPRFLEPSSSAYRRIELHHCPVLGYQVLAFVWGAGQGTPIHDHAGTWGVEAIWRGQLFVGEFDRVGEDGNLVRIQPRDGVRAKAGTILTVTPDHGLHLCRNESPREVAVSLQIYGCALDEYNEYVPMDDGWYASRPVQTWVE